MTAALFGLDFAAVSAGAAHGAVAFMVRILFIQRSAHPSPKSACPAVSTAVVVPQDPVLSIVSVAQTAIIHPPQGV